MERMTSSGRRWAFLVGVLVAFALPKHVDGGYPGAPPQVLRGDRACTVSEVEPWGFYLIEYALGRDVGFAYTHDDDCAEAGR